jgi:DHA1 family tetracycline resistance protein-like MFS transporter
MNSVAAIAGPILAAQSLAIGSRHGFVGAAFLVSGALLGISALIIALFTRTPASDSPVTAPSASRQ